MCLTGIALSNMSFPGVFLWKVAVHRGFSTPGHSDIAQTPVSGEKLFRESAQKKQRKVKPNISHCRATPGKLIWGFFRVFALFLSSQISASPYTSCQPQNASPCSPVLAQMPPSLCLFIIYCLFIAATSLPLHIKK